MAYNKVRKKLTVERRYEINKISKKGLDDKRQYEKELKQDRSHYNEKKQKCIDTRSQIAYIPQIVSEIFTDIVSVARDQKNFKCCSKLVRLCIEKKEKGSFTGDTSSKQ